jgi:hypothetical protein
MFDFTDLTYEAFEALMEIIENIEGDYDFPQLLEDVSIEFDLDRHEIDAVVALYDDRR